jgi:hypothetical protein
MVALTTATPQEDMRWLRSLKDNSSGSCGEGSFDRKGRYELNERIDRLIEIVQLYAKRTSFPVTTDYTPRPIAAFTPAARLEFMFQIKTILRAAQSNHNAAAELIINLVMQLGVQDCEKPHTQQDVAP